MININHYRIEMKLITAAITATSLTYQREILDGIVPGNKIIKTSLKIILRESLKRHYTKRNKSLAPSGPLYDKIDHSGPNDKWVKHRQGLTPQSCYAVSPEASALTSLCGDYQDRLSFYYRINIG